MLQSRLGPLDHRARPPPGSLSGGAAQQQQQHCGQQQRQGFQGQARVLHEALAQWSSVAYLTHACSCAVRSPPCRVNWRQVPGNSSGGRGGGTVSS